MTQYNKLNVKLSNSQLNKLKSAITNEIEVTLNFSSNIIGDSNDENNFPHRLLLTNAQDSNGSKTLFNLMKISLKSYDETSEEGYFLQVHLQLQFLPERKKLKKVQKLVGNLQGKNKYFIHIRSLKQALNDGLISQNVRRLIRFNQSE